MDVLARSFSSKSLICSQTWARTGDGDNYRSLKRIGWQIHVYGTADDKLRTWCQNRGVPLEVFAWSETMGHAGLEENALYLLRPDTYVALAETGQSVEAVEQYFARIRIRR